MSHRKQSWLSSSRISVGVYVSLQSCMNWGQEAAVFAHLLEKLPYSREMHTWPVGVRWPLSGTPCCK